MHRSSPSGKQVFTQHSWLEQRNTEIGEPLQPQICTEVYLSSFPMVFCLAFRRMVLSAVMKKPAMQAADMMSACAV
jgi:hypothetical protein